METKTFSFKKMRLKKSSANLRPFRLDLNVLNNDSIYSIVIPAVRKRTSTSVIVMKEKYEVYQ